MNLKKRDLFEGIINRSWTVVISNVKRRGEKKRDKYATIRVDLIFSIEMPGNQNNNFNKIDS